jgi:hypothetical protein
MHTQCGVAGGKARSLGLAYLGHIPARHYELLCAYTEDQRADLLHLNHLSAIFHSSFLRSLLFCYAHTKLSALFLAVRTFLRVHYRKTKTRALLSIRSFPQRLVADTLRARY